MIYYKLFKEIINILGLANVIFNIFVKYCDISNFIISDWSLILLWNFGYPYITWLESSLNFSLLSIYKLIVRVLVKIV